MPGPAPCNRGSPYLRKASLPTVLETLQHSSTAWESGILGNHLGQLPICTDWETEVPGSTQGVLSPMENPSVHGEPPALLHYDLLMINVPPAPSRPCGRPSAEEQGLGERGCEPAPEGQAHKKGDGIPIRIKKKKNGSAEQSGRMAPAPLLWPGLA